MGTMSEKTIANIGELEVFAENILETLTPQNSATVLALQGDLGAGKTALTKALAKKLGITDDITSPTFVVMKTYPITNDTRFKNLSHIDAYRIEDVDEMRILRFEELLADKERLIVIEWPEHVRKLLPEHTLYIKIEITDGETRKITYGDI